MVDRSSQNTSVVAGETEAAASPLLVGKRVAARLTGISARSVDRLVSARKFLPPVRLGGRVLWDRRALAEWVNNGCPRIEGR